MRIIKLLISLFLVIFLITSCANKNRYLYTAKYNIENSYSDQINIKLFQSAYRGDLDVFTEMLNSGANVNQLVSECDFKSNISGCEKHMNVELGKSTTIISAIFDFNSIKYENPQLTFRMLEQILTKLSTETIRNYYLSGSVSLGSDKILNKEIQKNKILLSTYEKLGGWNEQNYLDLRQIYVYSPLKDYNYSGSSLESKEKALELLKLYADKVINEKGIKYEDELLNYAIKDAYDTNSNNYIHFMTVKNKDTTISNYKDIFNKEKEKFLSIKNQKELEQRNQLIKDFNQLLKNKKIYINNIYNIDQINEIKKSENDKYYFKISNNFINKLNNKLRFTNIYSSTGMIITGITTSKLEEFTNKTLSQVSTQLIVKGNNNLTKLKEECILSKFDDNSIVIIEIDRFNKKLLKNCNDANFDRIFEINEKEILNYLNANCYKYYFLDDASIKKVIILNENKSVITDIIEIK